MVTNNSTFYSIKIIIEIFTNVIYFPFWWYSRGLVFFSSKVFYFLQYKEKSLALRVWIKNIFKPMYGQNDWQGFLISIAMRTVQIIFRSLIMLFWMFFCFFVLIFWLIFPCLIIYEIIFQTTNLNFNWILDLWQLIANR